MEQPAWLQHAWGELGTREAAGAADNQRILQYFRDVGQTGITHDSTPWCAAFAGACLERAGIGSARSLLARSYLVWGEAAPAEQLGAVVVLKRGSDPAAGHVGFLVGANGDDLLLLGGNQGDQVSVARFARADVLGVRWPASGPAAAASGHPAPAAEVSDPAFECALAHVLEMEGGYGDDPEDPGGPTNCGLTLEDLADARGVPLDATTRASLLAALKVIAADEVRAIYYTRYWLPSSAGALPAALGFMHFDAGVNQGLGTAARMLQETLGVDIDGEIGPLTKAAAVNADLAGAVSRYADLRRERYRALPGFARFGRGWLNRVNSTLARSLALIPQTETTAKGPSAMTTTSAPTSGPQTTAADSEPKWWGQSMTIWGTLITAIATVAPVLGPVIGIEISPDTVRQLGGQSADVVRGLAGLAGTIMALYGRSRAAQPLMRRDFSVKV